ncbi:MAG: sigma-70 family RNA polymerase sigma factor [Parvularculaceae bacterium]
MDDTHLVLLAQASDGAKAKKAFGQLVTRHQAPLRVFLRRYTGTHQDAEDIAQETFLLAWRHINQYRGDSLFRSWLFKISIREAGRKAGRDQRQQSNDLAHDIGVETSPTDMEKRLDLHQALARLPELERASILLCDGCGMSHAQAAAALETPLGSIKTYVARARNLLRTAMEREV